MVGKMAHKLQEPQPTENRHFDHPSLMALHSGHLDARIFLRPTKPQQHRRAMRLGSRTKLRRRDCHRISWLLDSLRHNGGGLLLCRVEDAKKITQRLTESLWWERSHNVRRNSE
ncbi:hypothetical protein RvY_07473-2 [Ramazzottius varieornatus]|uniref:Uncharacterized protein n=1 Tax=Ramazzottius varieornatus TaxID=947166 RepID=A0A1D1VBS4_RAMVA|nr:hypothetical protein RvY_07473-2 [Ramazzottius varieornatus]